jgi:DNA helicase-4
MLSSVKRYKARLGTALKRYFPRTAAYLQAEKEAAGKGSSGAVTKRRQAGQRAKAGTNPGGPKPGRSTKKPADGSLEKCAATARPQSPRAPRKPTEAIYPAAPFALRAGQAQAMRDRVACAVAGGVIGAPSEEQWAMILTSQPLTRVFAGAGSGKSTTLVLRLVFMLCHLQIPLERVTVISFTNTSCAELRERLLRLLRFWQVPVDECVLRQSVRTFHSAMAPQARQLLGHPQWFEQLGGAPEGDDGADHALLSSRLRAPQLCLLKQAYQCCYAEQPAFRRCVDELMARPAADAPNAPLEPFRLQGEWRAAPLFEVFYSQASFMQSIGIAIAQLPVAQLACSPREAQFLEALQRFHARFSALLQEQGMMTFASAFEQLTQLLQRNEVGTGAQSLSGCSHLLIDEFQDVSPQIVCWLQALQRRLACAGEAVSLMAIGDDWQSIYGWRGSSPELFMDFDRHFPRNGKAASEVLMLQANYRSREPLLRDAQKLLQPVRCKQAKQVRAVRTDSAPAAGVRLLTAFDVTRQLPELLRLIAEQCRYSLRIASQEPIAVLLLGRSHQVLKQIKAQLPPQLPVEVCTIHRAKGLQAEVAIIVDDCQPSVSHPLRNALYAHCGFFSGSYDQAMADEQLRLGYVAITRGVSRVFWCLRKTQGAASLLTCASARQSAVSTRSRRAAQPSVAGQ